MTNFKLKVCRSSGLEWKQYNSLQKCPCCEHSKPLPKQKKVYVIPQVSKKRKVEMLQYSVLRTEFLAKPENQVCFIDGCNKKATTVEHRSGRGINYLNVETWAGCCLEHNLELENNPELSKKYQLSKIHNGKKI